MYSYTFLFRPFPKLLWHFSHNRSYEFFSSSGFRPSREVPGILSSERKIAFEESSPKLLDPWRLCDLAFMLYSPGVTHKRLITGMAPTCDWMIKIVKVNKLYLNSLLVSIVNRVSQSRTMKYQCEWKHRCVKQEMITNVAKGRQPFLFSEVVQRHSGDEKVICWLNSFSQFRRTIRDWSHSCISPLTGIAPTQTFNNF